MRRVRSQRLLCSRFPARIHLRPAGLISTLAWASGLIPPRNGWPRWADLSTGCHQKESRRTRRGPVGFADTYHGKAVPLEAARQLVMINEEIKIPDLEQVIPYKRARSIVMKNPDHIVALDCPCRMASENPCLPMDVCLSSATRSRVLSSSTSRSMRAGSHVTKPSRSSRPRMNADMSIMPFSRTPCSNASTPSAIAVTVAAARCRRNETGHRCWHPRIRFCGGRGTVHRLQ